MTKINTKGLRTWIVIDEKKLAHNYRQLKKISNKKTKFCAVVKSNAYGHGLVDYSKAIAKLPIDYLAVDSIVEANRLRKEGIKKEILVLGFTLPELFNEASKNNINITISNFDSLKQLIKYSKKNKGGIKIHIKIDTGMHRQGFQNFEVQKIIKELKKQKDKITVQGIYTHFADGKNPENRIFTERQIAEFNKTVETFKGNGFEFTTHASATTGLTLYKEAHFDMVRIGIGLLGYYPSKEIKIILEKETNLKPILEWKSIISEVKEIPKGEAVGYGLLWKAKRNSQIAIIPIGYWHGLPKSYHQYGEVIIKNKRVKIIGAISMDMIIIDVTGQKVKQKDIVTIIGNGLPADEIADKSGTSHYELLTRINPLIKKFYIQ